MSGPNGPMGAELPALNCQRPNPDSANIRASGPDLA
jgi:hypothetical protein